jgi:apolipoprotein N-acyltransferase
MTELRFFHYFLAVLSGYGLAASFAPWGYGWLAWPALVPLFYAVLASRGPWAAARRGWIAGLAFYITALIWMANVVHYLAIVFWLVFAFWLALNAGLLRALWDLGWEHRPRLKALLWALAAGACWAGIEYFRSELWPLRCPWLALGYSQTYNPAVFQSLSVWGVYGLSAFMASAGAAWALALRRRVVLPGILAAAALVLAVAWGRHRLETVLPEHGEPLKVALVQAENAPLDRLVKFSLSPEARLADLLVWPEYSFYMPSDEAGEKAFLRHLEKALKPSRAAAVLGAVVKADARRGVKRSNYTLFLGRDKKPAGRYDKMHPVQFVETGLPENRRPAPVTTEFGPLGPQICYDLAFEDGTRKMAGQGARLLITPTLDPAEWGKMQHRQHSDMSAARAVESGLWLVRAASSGTSQVIDRLGFARAELEMGREGALVATAYAGHGGTFYTRFGWILAPLCLLFTLAAAALLLFKHFGIIAASKGEHKHG